MLRFTRWTSRSLLLCLGALVMCGAMVSVASPSHVRTAYAFSCRVTVFIHDSSGRYLDVKGNGGVGTPVITFSFNGQPNQHWCLEQTAENPGQYFLHPLSDVTNLCFSDPFVPPLRFDPIIVDKCDGSNQQRWNVNFGSPPHVTSSLITQSQDSSLGPLDRGFRAQVSLGVGGGNVWIPRL
jgi:hypothetical protein